ncbi:MAG: hypothetical protein IAG13_03450 [Deltaproteobacteria bacterium]|nr:hypothetical protein [Nannocystaceae bacterium]
MSDRDARFRRLRPDGDLFAHFGIELEAAASPAPASTPVSSATSCTHCRWYLHADQSSCPLCGHPVAARPGATP